MEKSERDEVIDRKYNLNTPADVRAILASNNTWLKMTLSVCYWHNHHAYQIHSSFSRHAKALKNKDPHRAQDEFNRAQKSQVMKLEYRSKLKGLLEMRGFKIKYRQMSGSVCGFQRKSIKRGVPDETPGSVVNINQSSLFLFSDLYTEEALLNLHIMSE